MHAEDTIHACRGPAPPCTCMTLFMAVFLIVLHNYIMAACMALHAVQPTVWASLRDRSQWATLLALALTVVAKLSCFPTPRTIRGRRLL